MTSCNAQALLQAVSFVHSYLPAKSAASPIDRMLTGHPGSKAASRSALWFRTLGKHFPVARCLPLLGWPLGYFELFFDKLIRTPHTNIIRRASRVNQVSECAVLCTCSLTDLGVSRCAVQGCGFR